MPHSDALSKEELNALLLRVRQDDRSAQEALFDVYSALVESSVCRALRSEVFSASDDDDLRQEARLALYSAALKYDLGQDRVTFGLFAKICITNRLISVRRKYLRRKKVVVSPQDRPEDPGNGVRTRGGYAALFGEAEKYLSEKERTVIGMRLSGMRYTEIADALGCSVKSIDNALLRAKSKLREYARKYNGGP